MMKTRYLSSDQDALRNCQQHKEWGEEKKRRNGYKLNDGLQKIMFTSADIEEGPNVEMLFNEGHVKGARVYTPFGDYIAISMPKQFKAEKQYKNEEHMLRQVN